MLYLKTCPCFTSIGVLKVVATDGRTATCNMLILWVVIPVVIMANYSDCGLINPEVANKAPIFMVYPSLSKIHSLVRYRLDGRYGCLKSVTMSIMTLWPNESIRGNSV
jgi:hypothetical protein